MFLQRSAIAVSRRAVATPAARRNFNLIPSIFRRKNFHFRHPPNERKDLNCLFVQEMPNLPSLPKQLLHRLQREWFPSKVRLSGSKSSAINSITSSELPTKDNICQRSKASKIFYRRVLNRALSLQILSKRLGWNGWKFWGKCRASMFLIWGRWTPRG